VARPQEPHLDDDTPRAGHGLFRTEGTRSTSQERLRSNEIAGLRHRDGSKRKNRRVVAQGDPLQGVEGIARRQCTRRDSNQRVHRNSVTLVTPTVRYLRLDLYHNPQGAMDSEGTIKDTRRLGVENGVNPPLFTQPRVLTESVPQALEVRLEARISLWDLTLRFSGGPRSRPSAENGC